MKKLYEVNILLPVGKESMEGKVIIIASSKKKAKRKLSLYKIACPTVLIKGFRKLQNESVKGVFGLYLKLPTRPNLVRPETNVEVKNTPMP